MSVARAATSVLQCNGCRLTILRSFSSLSGISLPSQSEFIFSRHGQGQRRNFNRPTRSFIAQQSLNDNTTKLKSEEHETPTDGKSNATYVPWYLQVDTQKQPKQLDPSHPMAERQRIPDLPEYSPPILQDLLQHISVDLGIDDLSLLDLRNIDPPPALGGSLLMVIGTARSEKHLHVSADRLCRWLRSTYQLRPLADGLLGRNELKLKLRRKARRSRIMASAGATEMAEVDDGIRTGWVCVNLGRVEPAKDVPVREEREGNFIGFGRRSDGVTVVVQMFTEEKRGEIDLEKLWLGIKRRSEKMLAEENPSSTPEEQKSPSGSQVTSSPIESNSPIHAASFNRDDARPHVSNSQTAQQVRQYHATHFRRNTMALESTTWDLRSLNETSPNSNNRRLESLDSYLQEPTKAEPIQASSRAEQKVPETVSFDQYVPLVHESIGASVEVLLPDVMEELIGSASGDVIQAENAPRVLWGETYPELQYLRSLSHKEAIAQLGEGPHDIKSTPFLRSFYEDVNIFAPISHWERKLAIFTYAIQLRHQAYTSHYLTEAYDRMLSHGLPITPAISDLILRGLAYESNRLFQSSTPDLKLLESSLDIVRSLNNHGYNALTPETFSLLLTNVTPRTPPQDPQTAASAISLQNRLLAFIDDYAPEASPLRDHDTALAMLKYHVAAFDQASFWHIWDALSRHFVTHTPAMYALAFDFVATWDHQAHAERAIRKLLQEMLVEEPSIKLGKVLAEKLVAAVRIAEPEIEALDGRTPKDRGGEWVRLWRTCWFVIRGSKLEEYQDQQRIEQEKGRKKGQERELGNGQETGWGKTWGL
ncbi:hypothetical protein M501DRAFT_834140 [Patellaria atrata CBS 101060]|uniref:ATPase synthesis protein 25 n=1 Tax=Patellaria atrata CBS 101060 TaxID=1346257 RepID=A0A9P4S9Y5_9PEZI|nr:hypothetical protein M501DRAFT_834140 [Patellaria atrata CBS 101060]